MSNRKTKVANVRGQRQNLRKPHVNSSTERGNRSQPGMVLYRKIPDQTRVIRCLRSYGNIATNGSSLLPILNFYNYQAYSNSSFSNISQEFQSYRVRRMLLKLFPVFNTSAAKPGTNDYPLSTIIVGLWWDKPATALGNILQTDGMKSTSTGKEFQISTNFLGFPDAQLWTETTSQIPNTQYYGISMGLLGVGLEASSNIFEYLLEFDVEFMGMQ